jgi:hypothetical protein
MMIEQVVKIHRPSLGSQGARAIPVAIIDEPSICAPSHQGIEPCI